MHVVIAVTKQGIEDGRENARVTRVEVIGGDEVQGGAGFGIVLAMPVRIIETARVRDFFGTQPKQKEVFLARGFGHLDGGAIRMPMVSAPFIMNFILLVPLAS